MTDKDIAKALECCAEQTTASCFDRVATKSVRVEHDTLTKDDSCENKTCNKCGKPFDIWDTQEDFLWSSRLGYGTKYDGCDLKLHLCCSCMEQLIDECVVSPVKENT